MIEKTMHKTLLATLVLSTITTTSVFAAATAYDIDQDVNIQANKDGINSNLSQLYQDETLITANTTAIGKINIQLNGKVDTTTYDDDQKKQDDALTAAIAAQASNDKTQDTAIAGKVDQGTYDADQKAQNDNVQANSDAIKKETQDRADEIQAVRTNLLNDLRTVQSNQAAIRSTANDAQTRVATLEPIVKQNQSDVGTLKNETTALAKGLSDTLGIIDQNKKDQASTDAAQDTLISHADQTASKANILAIHNKGRLDTLEPQVKANTAAIATKVDTTTYDAGQKAQDTRMDGLDKGVQAAISGLAKESADLKAETQERQTADKALQTKIDAKASTADVNQVAGALGSRIDSNKTAIATEAQTRATADTQLFKATSKNATDLANKVDQSSYDKGQKAQDTAIKKAQDTADTTAAVLANKVDQAAFAADHRILMADDAKMATDEAHITDNTQHIANDEKELASHETRIASAESTITSTGKTVSSHTSQIAKNTTATQTNTGNITNNTTNIVNNTTNITNNKTDIRALQKSQKVQDDRMSKDETTEANHFKSLSVGVKHAQDTGAYAQARADAAFSNADANRQALAHTNKQVSDHSKQLANHEQRLKDLESNTPTNFNKLQDQQNKDRKEFRAGLAGSYALSSIPQAPQGHSVGFGMGAGTFNGQNAVAAGVSARVSENVSVKTGMSWDSAGNVGAGFLVSY